MSDKHDLFGALRPFGPLLWASVVMAVVLKKVLIYLNGSTQFHINTSLNGTLYPITFGMMLIISLYRSQLLTKLLVHQSDYIVNDLDDLADLPDSVQIITGRSNWRQICEHAPTRLRQKLGDKVTRKDHFVNVVDAVRRGDAIYVSDGSRAVYYSRMCGHGLRVKRFSNVHPRWNHIGLSNASDPSLRAHLDRAIHRLGGFIQSVQHRYHVYYPGQAKTHCHNTSAEMVQQSHKVFVLELQELQGCFILLAAGVMIAVIAVALEITTSCESCPFA